MKTFGTATFIFFLILICTGFASAESVVANPEAIGPSVAPKSNAMNAFPMIWEGEYGGNSPDGITKRNLTIEITNMADDGAMEGIATITPSAKAPECYGVTGSYHFDGAVDFDKHRIRFHGTEWLSGPIGENADRFVFLSFRGKITDDGDLHIAGTTNYGFFDLSPMPGTEHGSQQPSAPIDSKASSARPTDNAQDVASADTRSWLTALFPSKQPRIATKYEAVAAGTKVLGGNRGPFLTVAVDNTDIQLGAGTVVFKRPKAPAQTFRATQQVTLQELSAIRRIRYYTNDTDQGDQLIQTQITRYGRSTTLHNGPLREGYVFLGWDTRKNATSASFHGDAAYAFHEDTRLYAIWKEAPQKLTIQPTAKENMTRTRTIILPIEVSPFGSDHLPGTRFDPEALKQRLVDRDRKILENGVRRNPDREGCNMKINGTWVQTVNCVWFTSMKLDALFGEENPGVNGWTDGQTIGDYRVNVIDPYSKFVFRDRDSTPETFMAMLGLNDSISVQDAKVILYVNNFGHTFMIDAIVAQTDQIRQTGIAPNQDTTEWRVYYTDNQPATRAVHTGKDIEVFDMTMDEFLKKNYTVERAVVLTKMEEPAAIDSCTVTVRSNAGDSVFLRPASMINEDTVTPGPHRVAAAIQNSILSYGYEEAKHEEKTGYPSLRYSILPELSM